MKADLYCPIGIIYDINGTLKSIRYADFTVGYSLFRGKLVLKKFRLNKIEDSLYSSFTQPSYDHYRFFNYGHDCHDMAPRYPCKYTYFGGSDNKKRDSYYTMITAGFVMQLLSLFRDNVKFKDVSLTDEVRADSDALVVLISPSGKTSVTTMNKIADKIKSGTLSIGNLPCSPDEAIVPYRNTAISEYAEKIRNTVGSLTLCGVKVTQEFGAPSISGVPNVGSFKFPDYLPTVGLRLTKASALRNIAFSNITTLPISIMAEGDLNTVVFPKKSLSTINLQVTRIPYANIKFPEECANFSMTVNNFTDVSENDRLIMPFTVGLSLMKPRYSFRS